MSQDSPEKQITRRELIGMGVAITASVAIGSYTIDRFLGEEDTIDPSDYSLVEGGKIVNDGRLIDLLNKAGNKKEVFPDPTLLKSTVYSALRYHGLSANMAHKAASQVYIGDLPNQDGLAGLDKNTPFLVVDNSNFEEGRSWSSLVHLLGHEATHISSTPDIKSVISEDYGPLGKAYMYGRIYGFSATDEEFKGPFNFIYPKASGKELPNTIEEWAAEVGRINFIRHLGNKGLSNEYTESVTADHLSCRCHAFLEPSIRREYRSASDFPEWLLVQHRENKRAEAFLQIGKVTLEQNPNLDEDSLSEASTRGLGMLSFSAFVYEHYTKGPGTSNSLVSERLDDARLVELSQQHQQFLDDIYKV